MSFKSKLLAVCVAFLGAGAAFAQAWPPATVRIVVPYPPGTEPDVLARDLGNALSRQTGKVFVVDNKPGANSIIGTEIVAKADGDGATLLMVDRLAIVTNPQLYSKLPYKWEDSLKPVSDLAGVHLFLGAREGLPVKNFAEFIAYAKANPKKVNVGTGGNGHVTHIGMEMLAQAHGVSFTYVPYKGVGPAMAGLVGGEVDAMMSGGLVMQPHARSGKVKAQALGNTARSNSLPEVPTIAEAGGKAGSIPSTVFGLFAPAKVSDALLAQINRAVVTAMASPELRANYTARGLEVNTTRPDETMALMKREAAAYEKIIRDAGIKIE